MQHADVVLVAGDDLWPPTNGGRERTAGITEALTDHLDVVVAVPQHAYRKNNDHPVPVVPYPSPKTDASYSGFASIQPRLGNAIIDATASAEIGRIVMETGAHVTMFAHSYLAAVALNAVDTPAVVDFPNIELHRLASLARAGSGRHKLSARFEALKARRWEPVVARRSRLALATTDRDADLLASWDADVRLVPNAARARTASRSPDDGHVLFLASAGYAPNDRAAERLVRRIWPRILDEEPTARLRIVGRDTRARYAWAIGTPSVDVVGEVVEVDSYIDGAATVVVPVDSGGGSQLKVVNALARGRVVVASPYSAESVPRQAVHACLVGLDDAEFAARTVEVLRDVRRRHELEEALGASAMPTWRDAVQPLLDPLAEMVHWG